ncbi:hypothetical protein MKW94_020286 [Papaver nudicaule]|uniref:SAM domain-containing protein n=1 Tax=Papaver nudicaule TaxID=74823 RepID=A0AA41RNN7_PAPNU|nr:hypothetical protein [Papaver nudicaule]
MAEPQQPEDQNNTNPVKTLVPGGSGSGGGGGGSNNKSENPLGLGTKRQRRPSVRLGDIGDQQDNNSNNRRKQQWNGGKFRQQQQSSQKELLLPGNNKSSKTRPLLNLGNGSDFDNETIEGSDQNPNSDMPMIGNRRGKSKRGGFSGVEGGGRNKRVRTNWVMKGGDEEDNEKFSGGDDDNGWYNRGFDSESPLKEQEESPNHLLENIATLRRANSGIEARPGTKRPVRSIRDNSNNHGGEFEMDASSDDNWKCGTSSDRNGNVGGGRERGECMPLEDGVQSVLNGLGLSRYAPVFEMHEVDEEVLPLLTLEDLKDMGINAVGSRRKLFCAIQKLAKGFT